MCFPYSVFVWMFEEHRVGDCDLCDHMSIKIGGAMGFIFSILCLCVCGHL